MVTKLLKRAIEEVSKLSSEEQDKFAALILEELESEVKWEELLGRTSAKLQGLAHEALEEHRKSKTEELNPDGL